MTSAADPWWGQDAEIPSDTVHAGLSLEEATRTTAQAVSTGHADDVAARATAGNSYEKALLEGHSRAVAAADAFLGATESFSGGEPSPLDWFRPKCVNHVYDPHMHCKRTEVTVEQICATPAFALDISAAQKRIERLHEAPSQEQARQRRASTTTTVRRKPPPPLPPSPQTRAVDTELVVRALPLEGSVMPLAHRGSVSCPVQIFDRPIAVAAPVDVDAVPSLKSTVFSGGGEVSGSAGGGGGGGGAGGAGGTPRRRAEVREPQEPTVLCPVRVETGCSLSYNRGDLGKLRAHLTSVHGVASETLSEMVQKALQERVHCPECSFTTTSETPSLALFTHLRSAHKTPAAGARTRAEKTWTGLGRMPKK